MSGVAGAHGPSAWPAEDGGPRRLQVPHGPVRGFGLVPGQQLEATSRMAIASTMVVLRDPGEAYLLCHTGGDGAHSWVERFDPVTLEVLERSPGRFEPRPPGRHHVGPHLLEEGAAVGVTVAVAVPVAVT